MEGELLTWWNALTSHQQHEVRKVVQAQGEKIEVQNYFMDTFGLRPAHYAGLLHYIRKLPRLSPLMFVTKALMLHMLGFLGFPYPARVAATNKQLNDLLRGTTVDLFDSTIAAQEMIKYFPTGYWQLTGMTLHFTGERAEITERHLPMMSNVHRFRIQGLIEDLSFLAQCPHIVTLELPCSNWVTDLGPLIQCRSLQSISLGGCQMLSNLSPLSQCENLESVRIVNAVALCDLSPFVTIRALHTLTLSGLPPAANLSVLQFCNLHTLFLSLTWLESLKPLGLCNVRSFVLRSMSLKDVSGLATWPQLEQLTLSDCHFLMDISPLTRSSSLQFVKLQNMPLSLKQACVQLSSPTTIPFLDPATESIRIERRSHVLGKRSVRLDK